MIKYKFMRAHDKSSEGSEKGGVHAAQAPPLNTPLESTYIIYQITRSIDPIKK